MRGPADRHDPREDRDRELVEELGTRRMQYVVDVAHDLLNTGQSGVAA
jgi:hypothetical protein